MVEPEQPAISRLRSAAEGEQGTPFLLVDNTKGPRLDVRDLQCVMVGRRGVEPRTLGLRVPCSTN